MQGSHRTPLFPPASQFRGCRSIKKQGGFKFHALHQPSNSHCDHGGSHASGMTFGWWSAGFSGGVTSLCARSRGEPSSAHCEQRLSERLTPCPCDPVCACTGMRGHAFLPAHPHAAQRAVPGWRGGLGRVGADLASAGSMRPPPSPARHVSTAWLATTKARQETACHHTHLVKMRIAEPRPAILILTF